MLNNHSSFGTLVDLQQEALIRHLGVSNVTVEQVAEAQSIAGIVCVQSMYNLAHRHDDALIGSLTAEGIAYVPFFPLGGFTPLQSGTLSTVATRLGTTPMSVALAWPLRRSPYILLIPDTSQGGTAARKHHRSGGLPLRTGPGRPGWHRPLNTVNPRPGISLPIRNTPAGTAAPGGRPGSIRRRPPGAVLLERTAWHLSMWSDDRDGTGLVPSLTAVRT
jgi:hypothetical protein